MAGPPRIDFTGSSALMRGDTFGRSFAIEFEDDAPGDLLTPGVVLRCTIKRFEDDPDPGLAQVDTLTGGIVILSATTFRVVVPDDVTEGFPIALLHYDVTLDWSPVHSDDVVRPSRMQIIADVTRSHL